MEKHKQEQEITNTQAPTTEKATKTMPKTGRESNSHKPNDNQARGALHNLEMTKEKDTGISHLKWPAKTQNMPPEWRKLKN